MTWKKIPQCPNYEASDGGDIRNIRTGRILKPYNDRLQEYDRVSVYIGGRKRKKMVHRLVADAWLGAMPDGSEIDHINTNIHDNRPSNLSYKSQADNHLNPLTVFNREVARIRSSYSDGRLPETAIFKAIDALKEI